MAERERQKKETAAQETLKVLGFYPIIVRNEFDEDARNIKVSHKDKDGNSKGPDKELKHMVKHPHEQRDGSVGQKIRQEDIHFKKYYLELDESLVIELGTEEVDFRKSKKDVYIGLPFLADYEFYWELETGGEKKQVARPITSLRRDTHSKEEENEEKKNEKPRQTKKGRTLLKIPSDQRAWRLKISRPGNLDRYIREENIILEDLEMQNGDHDDVTVSDNGSG